MLCSSADAAEPDAHQRRPVARYRNNGPIGLHRLVSGKFPPQWMARAVGYVDAVGGLPAAELEYVGAWFQAHRVGTPVGALVSDLAAK